MTTKHTPGPWLLVRFRASFIVDRPNNLEPICEISRASGEGSREEFEANARLIAAAPELLGELKLLVGMFADDLARFGGTPAMSRHLSAAREAIAKAEGKS